MENLFSYGTLQKEKVQLALFGRLLTGAKDILKNYKLAAIQITDESFLATGAAKSQLTLIESKDAADFIAGSVFEVSEAELMKADAYEPENYKRKKVVLESGKTAWIYAASQID